MLFPNTAEFYIMLPNLKDTGASVLAATNFWVYVLLVH